MNCQSFESAVNDLARDQMMDAAERDRALLHSAACQHCAARLADERALTAGLRKLAASVDGAPAHIESSLIQAFRARAATSGEPAVVQIASRSRRWLPWAAAAAILIVALLALTAARLRNDGAKNAPADAAHQKDAKPISAPEAEPKTLPDIGVAGVTQIAQHKRLLAGGRRSAAKKKLKPIYASETRTELATDFIPLIHGDLMSPSDGGQIVRVEMPRAALVAFGFPMNMDRAAERVKADVVVGNDGLARAIRFVH